MAERRMFAKTIIDSDAFLEMPLSTQALYFHLSMRADDDGFLNNAIKIQRMIGANQNDYDLLVAKRFILQFEDGICVIKHWRIHNYIQRDRYKPTIYQEEKNLLEMKDNSAYSLRKDIPESVMDTPCIQNGYRLETQVRLGKDRLGKDREIHNVAQSTTAYPYREVIAYLNSKAETAFKDTSKDSRKHIKARFDEGFSLDDFKKVIDIKVAEWKGTDMSTFLRPATLFGTKFEGYLNQKKAVKKREDKPKNQFQSFPQREIDYDALVMQGLQDMGGDRHGTQEF